MKNDLAANRKKKMVRDKKELLRSVDKYLFLHNMNHTRACDIEVSEFFREKLFFKQL